MVYGWGQQNMRLAAGSCNPSTNSNRPFPPKSTISGLGSHRSEFLSSMKDEKKCASDLASRLQRVALVRQHESGTPPKTSAQIHTWPVSPSISALGRVCPGRSIPMSLLERYLRALTTEQNATQWSRIGNDVVIWHRTSHASTGPGWTVVSLCVRDDSRWPIVQWNPTQNGAGDELCSPRCTRLHHRSANHHPSVNEAIAIRYNCYLRSIQGGSHIHQLIEARESLQGAADQQAAVHQAGSESLIELLLPLLVDVEPLPFALRRVNEPCHEL